MKGKIAIIPIKGTIVSESGFIFPLPVPIKVGGTISSEIIEFLEEVEKNKKIKAIVLEIDSPGGTPYPCKEIAMRIQNFSKPVIAWVKESATSGAYWIASACKKIVADHLSIIGSIGVTSLRPDFTELLKKFGIDIETLASGIHKTLGLPFQKTTPEEKEILKQEIEIIYQHFLQEVAKNRNLSEEVVKEISTGKIYLGEEAKRIGLIDILGGKNEALKTAQEITKLKTYQIVDYNKKIGQPKGLLSKLLR